MINDLKNKSLIASGDQKKFRQLMELTSDDLLIFAIGFIRDKETAEEIVSDVFVKIWNNRKALLKVKNIKSYLFISVKNGCLSHLRKSSKNKNIISIDEFEDFKFLPVEGPLEDDLIEEETVNLIYNAIDKLPPKCKLAFTLAKINGLKYKEIAEIMDVSEKTVNNHLVNAVNKISEILSISKKTSEKPASMNRASLF
ncbi:RNA polymerase sigma-70 factor [Maribellus maritimus]|uniref:RNA polymerase sigma-70 factor n=1 Tax=Maribellus maritimus TaxID=2870838 RepID=UPI001EE9E64A|nr:RNA polymerase sigma-70 factor [Maribellus maritimus]MCG6189218.1 RNA polymerase sigma-70 factor [Maribellus maritimus]